MNVHVSVCNDASDPRVARLGAALTRFNDDAVGASRREPLAVLVENEQGELVAGLSGMTAWGWLYVQWLWVDAPYRGQGLAGELLTRAEAEAHRRGCRAAHIDTFSEQARRVYEQAGYGVFGELPDFTAGRTRWFLAKRWDAVGPGERTGSTPRS